MTQTNSYVLSYLVQRSQCPDVAKRFRNLSSLSSTHIHGLIQSVYRYSGRGTDNALRSAIVCYFKA